MWREVHIEDLAAALDSQFEADYVIGVAGAPNPIR
jgi:hypothetical protein